MYVCTRVRVCGSLPPVTPPLPSCESIYNSFRPFLLTQHCPLQWPLDHHCVRTMCSFAWVFSLCAFTVTVERDCTMCAVFASLTDIQGTLCSPTRPRKKNSGHCHPRHHVPLGGCRGVCAATTYLWHDLRTCTYDTPAHLTSSANTCWWVTWFGGLGLLVVNHATWACTSVMWLWSVMIQ